MSGAFNKVRSFIERHAMLEGARGVVVAVSGGADSVALLDMLVRLNLPVSLCIAHFDHQLRGQESLEDAMFVRALSEKLTLTVISAGRDVRAVAAASGKGIEETARELRYNFLLATAHKVGADRIATGHTMNDQAETLLMRLARGTGLRGLAAMRPVIPAHFFKEWESGRMGQWEMDGASPAPPLPHSPTLLIRPLLCITREEVEEYCRERGLAFRTDSTNLLADYTRNRVRRDVLPVLQAINPRAVEHIARAADIAASDEEALDYLAPSMLDRARAQSAAGVSYTVASLIEQPEGLRRRMLMEAIRRESAAPVTFRDVIAVEGLLKDGMSGSRASLPGGLEAWREFDALVFKATGKDTPREQEISRQNPRAEMGGVEIVLQRDLPGDLREASLEEARREREGRSRDWTVAVLDDEKLPEILTVRPRRAGERALVLGQTRIKKLKKLMIDHKIPSSRRALWPVVATPDGQYVWAPGLPPAVNFAASNQARRLAILRAAGV